MHWIQHLLIIKYSKQSKLWIYAKGSQTNTHIILKVSKAKTFIEKAINRHQNHLYIQLRFRSLQAAWDLFKASASLMLSPSAKQLPPEISWTHIGSPSFIPNNPQQLQHQVASSGQPNTSEQGLTETVSPQITGMLQEAHSLNAAGQSIQKQTYLPKSFWVLVRC